MPSIEQAIGLAALDPAVKFDDPQAATILDANDEFASFRSEFSLPTVKAIGGEPSVDGESCTYFVGNSLGPLCKRSKEILDEEMNVWASIGVEGHFRHPHQRDWMTIASNATKLLAPIVGCKEGEVACMGTLTANLHLLMGTFYKPTKDRYKIVCEDHAFPSDQYAFAAQASLHGFAPETTVIRVSPRLDEHTLRLEDILSTIQEHGSSVALVLFSGVQYYTGQYFNIPEITKAAHDIGAVCGWDLAHAVGNVPLQLHDWDVDFAVWCSYKYLNGGPGAIGGLFVHEKWNQDRPAALHGWWGHDESTRFKMPDTFKGIIGAQGYQQSNPSVMSMAPLLGSLETFERAGGVPALRLKSLKATTFLEALFKRSPYYVPPAQLDTGKFTIITPENAEERGAQLSLLFATAEAMEGVFQGMIRRGVIGDERRPFVIRFAPIPLYCTFADCRKAADALDAALSEL